MATTSHKEHGPSVAEPEVVSSSARDPQRSVGTDTACLLVFALLSLAVFGLLEFGSLREVVLRLATDDAFYYFGIAKNWARGAPSSFDGLTQTNGYHPLWQYLLAGMARLGTVEGLVRSGCAMGVVFLGVATLLVYRRLRWLRNRFAGLALLWVAGVLVVAPIYGLESPLAILLFAGLLTVFPADGRDPTPLRGLACGGLSGLLFLSRLDSLVWVAAADLTFLLGWMASPNPRRRAALRFLVVAGSVQLLMIGTYLEWNRLAWGHLLPISALVKAGRSPGFSFLNPWRIPREVLFLVSLPVTAVGLVLLARRLPRAIRQREWATSPSIGLIVWLALGNYGYLLAVLVKGGAETYYWYFSLTVFSGAFLIPVFLEDVSQGWAERGRRALFGGTAAACLALAAVSVWVKQWQPTVFQEIYDRAVALAEFPEGSMVLASGDCGVLGTLSRQHCLNLEGLASSFEYEEALRDDTLPAFLKAHGLSVALVEGPLSGTPSVLLFAKKGMYGVGRTVVLDLEPWMEITIGPAHHRRPLSLYKVRNIRPVKTP